MLILIDADPIVYRCGFASETTGWNLVYETVDGVLKEIEFWPTEEATAGAQMASWRAGMAGFTILSKTRLVKPDPLSYALRATKVQIESIIEECEKHFKQSAKMLMWISGKGGSYRDKIATVKPYKGNRDPTHKPYHYDAIRDYLRERYGSYITHGIEADDAVSIFAHNIYATGGESLVIATIDKDLDQIPGNHYNYMNKVFYAITQTEAERFFVFQCLTGDDTDNVGGVWKCGDKAAESILGRLDFRSELSVAKSTTKRRNQSVGSADAADTAIRNGSDARSDVCADGEPSRSGGNVAVAHAAGPDLRSGQSGESIGGTGASGILPIGEHGNDTGTATRKSAGGAASDPQQLQSKHAARSVYKWWPVVVRAYADSQRKPGCPYAQANPEAIAIECAQLVKLQEYPGQLWHPHGDLVVPGFGQEDFDE